MRNNQEFYRSVINHLPKEEVRIAEPIKNHVFTQMGGNADFFITPTAVSEIQAVIKEAKRFDIPVTILGNGSNVIVKDGGLRGVTISSVKMNRITTDNNRIIAQCGASIIDVSRQALKSELTGLEFACGIPGTVGGALYMNAGAYGGEIAEVLERAAVLTGDGQLLTLSKDEFAFGYRKSIFKEKDYLILEAEFLLEQGDVKAIKAKMEELTIARETKQPLEYPSCGSVFKRPPGLFAGKLIQDSGLQGMRIGGAEVSKKHAGFIVNVAQATSKDYTSLISYIQRTVKAKLNVELEREVVILGEDD